MLDANGTRYHLFLSKRDWIDENETDAARDSGAVISESDCSPPAPDLVWDPERRGLCLLPEPFMFPSPKGDRVPHPKDRRGAACDRYGNWYWIADDEQEILVLPASRRTPVHFWSPADLARQCPPPKKEAVFTAVVQPAPQAFTIRGLAVTEDHYLVAGVCRPDSVLPGLLSFDLFAGGPPLQLQWPESVSFEPFDMAPAPGGGVWILDRSAQKRFWHLDRYFRVTAPEGRNEPPAPDAPAFSAAEGNADRKHGCLPEQSITPEMAVPVEAVDPVAIEALSDGSVLILDADQAVPYSTIFRYRFREKLGSLELKSGRYLQHPIKGHDMAFVQDTGLKPGKVKGTLFVAESNGNQAYAYPLKGEAFGEGSPQYFPMRLFSGKALVAGRSTVHYDLKEQWIPLVEQPMPRFRSAGDIITRPLDGKERDRVWHRLLLDGAIPQGTSVTIESRCANRTEDIVHQPWVQEPRLYRRSEGCEMAFYQPLLPSETERQGAGTWEILFQKARGRYIQLRIVFSGNKRSTPLIRSLRIYYPRFSYLNEYLPAVYSQDPISASFLDRFLANVEGLYTSLEGKIAEAQVLLDVRTAPAEYLDWLAGWFGVIFERDWEENRRRLFLRHAMKLFKQRGTLEGLLRAVRLATDPCPDDTLFKDDAGFEESSARSIRLVERHRVRTTPGLVYGDPSEGEKPGIATGSAWNPAHGVEAFHRDFRVYCGEKYQDMERKAPDIRLLNKAWTTDYNSFDEIRFSPIQPRNEQAAEDWRYFVLYRVRFTYAEVTAADEPLYRDFLARRYRYPQKLNDEYQWTGNDTITSFKEVTLPGENDMPSGGKRLYDWIQFVSLVVPIKRSAHRFSVLVPADLESSRTEQERRLEQVRKIVQLEKPAHTNFDVKPYWALFRVGEARLGPDTLLDQGARFTALALGRNALGNSFLDPPDAWRSRGPMVADRDAIRRDCCK